MNLTTACWADSIPITKKQTERGQSAQLMVRNQNLNPGRQALTRGLQGPQPTSPGRAEKELSGLTDPLSELRALETD